MCRIGLILLAAGASTRLGQPKQLVQFGGRSLLRRAAEAATASGSHPIIVVLGAEAERMRAELHGLPVITVENAAWERGMASSLHVGMDALPPDVEGCVVILCDQPLLTTDTINALADAWRSSGAPLAACEYDGTLGVPALFGRTLLPELRGLSGTDGAKKVILRHAHQAARVPFPGGGWDIDTPDDLAHFPNR